jgi:hypothetical protein
MTNRFSRTGRDYIVGFWALAPAVVIPLMLFAWWHHATTFPSDPTSFDEFDRSFQSNANHLFGGVFVAGALYLIALAVVIRDIWMRAMDQNLRIMWTVLTLVFAPFGGVVYWYVVCHSRRDLRVAADDCRGRRPARRNPVSVGRPRARPA